MDAVTLAAAIKKKELSPVEVVDAHLARMDELEPVDSLVLPDNSGSTPAMRLARSKHASCGARRWAAGRRADRHEGPGLHRWNSDGSGSIAYKDFVSGRG